MYKHILVPTDGSRLAEKGVKSGVRLAKALSARITGVFVIAPYMPPIYGDAAVYIPGIARQDYEKLMKKEARKVLEFVLGSETSHVLTHSKIPVLVTR